MKHRVRHIRRHIHPPMRASLSFTDSRFLGRGLLRFSRHVKSVQEAEQWANDHINALGMLFGPAEFTVENGKEIPAQSGPDSNVRSSQRLEDTD